MYVYLAVFYTSIQMICQGRVIVVHATRLFYYPKRRIGYAAVHSPVTKTTEL